MSRYHAPAGYDVDNGAVRIRFDHNGWYETDDKDEISVLDALVPTWVTKVDEPSDDKPATKRQTAKPDTK